MSWKTILIDDDPICTFLTQYLLELENFSSDISAFQKAEEAVTYVLDNIKGELPTVILLDLNMPVVNGWDFLQALTPYQELLQAWCKIFILSSSLDAADQKRSMEHPLVVGFIQKPLRLEDIELIRAELNKNASSL